MLDRFKLISERSTINLHTTRPSANSLMSFTTAHKPQNLLKFLDNEFVHSMDIAHQHLPHLSTMCTAGGFFLPSYQGFQEVAP
jgi:hypothetical protein